MTIEEREEAIEYIKTYRELDEKLYQTAPFNTVSKNALTKCLRYWDMAIKALEQEPKTDYKAFAEWVAEEIIDEENWKYNADAFPEIACRKLNKWGVVKTDGKNWIYENEALEQEPCEDCISRQAVLEAVDFYDGFNQQHFTVENLREDIEKLPSVNPQEPKVDILDKIRAIVKEWQDDSWTDNLSYECMIKISELFTKSEGWNETINHNSML